MAQTELTPKQQALMDFLDKLATTPVTPEMLARGNQLLDAAALEYRQQHSSNPQQQRTSSQQPGALLPCQIQTER